jgi:uncharacterized protein YlxW (UPF0749 family)
MSVFATGMNHRSYYWQITVLCFVLGLMVAAAWHTATQVSRAGDGPTRVGFVYNMEVASKDAAHQAAEFEDEIKRLRKQAQDRDNELATRNGNAKALNDELKEMRMFAGLTEVVGPGVEITLSDSAKHSAQPGNELSLYNLIHDVDIAQVVNELKASGAEAISINGQRIISTSTIRCVGPVVQINGVPSSAPYAIHAIGDPEAMFGGVNLQNGVLDQIRRLDPNMVRVEKKAELHLPAFAGNTRMRYARQDKSNSDTATTDAGNMDAASADGGSKEKER